MNIPEHFLCSSVGMDLNNNPLFHQESGALLLNLPSAELREFHPIQPLDRVRTYCSDSVCTAALSWSCRQALPLLALIFTFKYMLISNAPLCTLRAKTILPFC